MSVAAPIWILAAPFSGASWFAGCLGQHPRLYAVPELHLFMAATVGELLDIFDIGQGAHAHGLLRALAELEFGEQSDRGIEQARSWLDDRRDWPTHAVARHLALCAAPRRLVVPDSEAALRPLDLWRLRTSLPEAQLIHLVRHPWEQGCLLAAWARERLFVPQDFKDHAFLPPQVEPQLPWLRANANLERLRELLPAVVPVRLRSEDVEQQTDASLLGVCAALGLPFDAATADAMRHADDWPFAGHGPGTAPCGLEAEALEPFSAKTLALAADISLWRPLPWRDAGEPFAHEVQALATRYGYV